MSTTTDAPAPQSAAELVELFRGLGDGQCVRLIGSGTKQLALSAVPADDATRCRTLRLDGLRAIHRMEAADLTCSVGVGLPLEELCLALGENGVELPGIESLLDARMGATPTGTVGGLYAAGMVTPSAPGAWTPRNTLLGFEAVLPEGLAFKAGARVVKNVAGFDLNKLFVGSRGRLFAATTLHLKLRAAPPARARLLRAGLEENEALTLYSNLRREPAGVEALRLERDVNGGHCLRAVLSGRPALLDAIGGRHRLAIDETSRSHSVTDQQERVLGTSRPSDAKSLLRGLPGAAVVDGTGGFLAQFPHEVETILSLVRGASHRAQWLPSLRAPWGDADPPMAPGIAALNQRLLNALDPAERLR